MDTYRIKSNSVFSIAVELGCNLFRWETNGRPVLWSPEGFGEDPEQFFKGGNPILFPSVGRTWDRTQDPPVFGQYRIDGRPRAYEMPIHGILPFCSWAKARETLRDDQVNVEYACTIPTSVREKYYPFNVGLTIRYVLRSDSVVIETVIENRDTVAAPFAFGLHPYFAFADKSKLAVRLPCRGRMVLDPKMLIPVGHEPLESPNFPLEPTRTYDNGFTDVSDRRATIIDGCTGRSLHIDIDGNVETFVIYANPQLPFVCLEPWTKGLGAYETLANADWQTRGALPILQPGETRQIRIAYQLG